MPNDQARIDPDRETGLMTADIVLVADLVSFKEPAKSQQSWLLQIKGSGVVVGGPTRVEVPPDAELSELVSVDIAPGDHPIRQGIRLGKILDSELTLTIE